MCLIIGIFVVAVLFAIYFLVAVGTFFALVPWIIVGLIAGWAASTITESPHGIVGDIIIGLAGSFIGGVLYVALLHQRIGGGVFSPTRIIVAIVGSVMVLVFVKVLMGSKT